MLLHHKLILCVFSKSVRALIKICVLIHSQEVFCVPFKTVSICSEDLFQKNK